MADFNWYLNRQGLRGITGEKGDQGFSPYFTVEESTANQYRLRVHNENDSFVTENLRGNAIEIRNPDGNYIKYDHNTGDFYVDDADYATTDSEGQVILATINDVVIGNETKAVTPSLLLDSLPQLLVNNDSNLTITQNQDNSLTEINLANEVIHPNLKYAPNNNYLITGDIRYNNPIRVTKGVLDDTGRRGCTFELMYDTNHFSRGSQGLILSNSIISFINNTRSDLEAEKTVRGNADTQLQNAINAERQERQTETSALNTAINDITNTMVTIDGYQTISNKTINGKLNFRNPETYIMAESARDFTINANNYLYLQAKDNVGVYIGDNKANYNFTDKGHINVFTPTDGTNYFLRQDTVTAGDNITIEKDGKGIKISATGGGSGGGDMTTNTDQDVTGVKNFIGATLKLSDSDGGNSVNFEVKNQDISTPDRYSSVSSYLDVSGKHVMGKFAQYRFVYDPTGFRLAYSPCIDMEGLVAGNGIEITKDYGNDRVTISATGGGGGASSFSELTGSPYDNDSLAAALNIKINNNTIATANTLGLIRGGNWLRVAADGKLECGELTYSQYQSALGYTFISKTTLENRLANLPTGGAEIDDENVSTTKVFSSNKTSELVGEVGNELQDLTQRVNNIESLKVPNVVIVGEPLIQDGQVSGLDQTNHLQFPFILERQGRSWEYNGSFTTGSNVTSQENIIDSKSSIALAVRNSRLVIALSSNGTTFNLGEHTLTDLTIQPNTTYYVKISYIDNMGYVLEADVAPITYGSPHLSIGHANTPIAATTMLIGSDGNSFGGTLDLNKWSLKVDEQLIWLGMDNVGQAVSANVSLSNINEAGKKVIADIIEAKFGDIEALIDEVIGEKQRALAQQIDDINGEDVE